MSDRPAKILTVLAIVLLLALLVPGLLPVLNAFGEESLEIHRDKTCTADGWCVPELYLVRQDPAANARVKIDYTPVTTAYDWTIELWNVKNSTTDALVNYQTRGCGVFFSSCPDTFYLTWLYHRETLTIHLTTDTLTSFRLLNVPVPWKVTVDGVLWTAWSTGIYSVEVRGIVPGLRTVVFYVASPGGTLNPAIASFKYDLLSIWDGCTFRLTWTGEAWINVTQVLWDFPDGSTDRGFTVNHTFLRGCTWARGVWLVRTTSIDRLGGVRSVAEQVVLDRLTPLLVIGLTALVLVATPQAVRRIRRRREAALVSNRTVITTRRGRQTMNTEQDVLLHARRLPHTHQLHYSDGRVYHERWKTRRGVYGKVTHRVK